MVRSRTSFPEGDFRPIEASVIILHGEDHFEAGTFCRSSSAKFSRKVKLVVKFILAETSPSGSRWPAHRLARLCRQRGQEHRPSRYLDWQPPGVLRLRKPQRRCRIAALIDGRLLILAE